jgi:hypothetical protein
VGGTVRQDMARDQINVIRSARHGIQMQQYLEVPERNARKAAPRDAPEREMECDDHQRRAIALC